jgi:hypothetical protein
MSARRVPQVLPIAHGPDAALQRHRRRRRRAAQRALELADHVQQARRHRR